MNILIAMSIPGESGSARKTALAAAHVLGLPRNDIRVGIAIESDRPRTEFDSFLEQLKHTYAVVAVWDQITNDAVLDRWTAPVWPAYREFSYGAFQNKALAMCAAGEFDAVVRLDPGTSPPSQFEALILELLDNLNRGKLVVSTQYDGRLPLRSDFVPRNQLDTYYSLIHEYTGIDPRFGRQLAGGGALTIGPAGPPAPVFKGVKVWASDDGFYFLALGLTRMAVLPDLPRCGPRLISRSEPGFRLEPSQYAERLANAVLLRDALAGTSPSHAESDAKEFLRRLAATAPGKITPDSITLRHDLIYEGYDNWVRLCADWDNIRNEMVRIVHDLPRAAAIQTAGQ